MFGLFSNYYNLALRHCTVDFVQKIHIQQRSLHVTPVALFIERVNNISDIGRIISDQVDDYGELRNPVDAVNRAFSCLVCDRDRRFEAFGYFCRAKEMYPQKNDSKEDSQERLILDEAIKCGLEQIFTNMEGKNLTPYFLKYIRQ